MPPPAKGQKCHPCVRNTVLPISQEGHDMFRCGFRGPTRPTWSATIVLWERLLRSIPLELHGHSASTTLRDIIACAPATLGEQPGRLVPHNCRRYLEEQGLRRPSDHRLHAQHLVRRQAPRQGAEEEVEVLRHPPGRR